MTTREPQQEGSHGPDAVRLGLIVFAVLAVLTVVEYLIAVSLDKNIVILAVMAVAKALLIVYYFMHVVRAWASGGEGE
jgi:heme/copper-type cytochrome/quinol oxidase subunit 4